MGEVTRKIWKCDRCDHEWLSRDGDTPLRCARCKSPYWNKPRNKILSKNIKTSKIKESRI